MPESGVSNNYVTDVLLAFIIKKVDAHYLKAPGAWRYMDGVFNEFLL